MYSSWQLAFKYLRYYLTASNGRGHGTHSPFIFHFIQRVLNHRSHFPEYTKVELARKQLLLNKTLIALNDLGAGSSQGTSEHRTVASIAKNSAKPPKFGQLLFRMAREYKPRTILELGTSLGLTTSYLALGNPGARIISLEGAEAVADLAVSNLEKSGITNVEIIRGDFDERLSPLLDELSMIDLAFIDGNHRQEPTERYFRQLLPKTNNDSILVFDDIHWSREMEAAWTRIKSHPQVSSSIDLFFIGIVFFRQEFREKQHFSIRF